MKMSGQIFNVDSRGNYPSRQPSHRVKPKHPPGPPMTLGNMRALVIITFRGPP